MIVIITSMFSVYEARSGLKTLASRHIAFKAEELRNFAYSEWESLRTYNLDENPDLRAAVEESVISYARALLRDGSEKVLIFDRDNTLSWELSLYDTVRGSESDHDQQPAPPSPGWLEFEHEDEERIGIVFEFTPFGWSVIISELKSSFFTEIGHIERNSAVILIISILAVLLLIPLSLGHVIRRLENLSTTAFEITENRDFSRRVEVVSRDETGQLADRFNAMLDALQDSNRKLETKSLAEKKAREAAEDQEREALFLLSRISDIRDEDTGNHLKRIGVLAAYMGELLDLSSLEQEILLNCAPLHDIGKIGVSDAILLKKGKLSTLEKQEIQSHTTLGYELLRSSRSLYLKEGADIALTHHERWEGKGYPSGLKGEEIPLYGRIVSIVDVFDALLSVRPYKKSYSSEETLAYIDSQRGRHFDPMLTDLFIHNFQSFLKIREEVQFMEDPDLQFSIKR